MAQTTDVETLDDYMAQFDAQHPKAWRDVEGTLVTYLGPDGRLLLATGPIGSTFVMAGPDPARPTDSTVMHVWGLLDFGENDDGPITIRRLPLGTHRTRILRRRYVA